MELKKHLPRGALGWITWVGLSCVIILRGRRIDGKIRMFTRVLSQRRVLLPRQRKSLCLCPPLFTGSNCERSTESQCPAGYCLNGELASLVSLPVSRRLGRTGLTSSLPTICNGVTCSGDCVCEESRRHDDGYVCISNAGFLGRVVLTVTQAFYAEWDTNQANSVIYMSPIVNGIDSTMPQCRAQLVGSTCRIAVSHMFAQCGTQTSTDVGPDGFNRVYCNEPCPAPLIVQQSAVYTVGHLNFGVFTPSLGVTGNVAPYCLC